VVSEGSALEGAIATVVQFGSYLTTTAFSIGPLVPGVLLGVAAKKAANLTRRYAEKSIDEEGLEEEVRASLMKYEQSNHLTQYE
jgi:hypothetical protein